MKTQRESRNFLSAFHFGQAMEGVPCSGERNGLYSPRARRVPPMGFDPHAFRVRSIT